MLKRILKNEKGLTLIELLAVVVILGIIAAIAVPSIGGIIDNSKKDAHVANAQQMVNSAKIALTGDSSLHPAVGADIFIPLAYLEGNGYLETVKDPDGSDYAKGANATSSSKTDKTSYVKVTNNGGKFTYSVALYGSSRNIPETAEKDLKRSLVVKN
ncbi:type II secretion system GspH family protein [Bacillus timonensis]|nr:type II secretion system GspH family protein [Bacillus timonensis]